MFDARYRRYVLSFLLVLPMTAIVTAVNTIISQGLSDLFVWSTVQKWGISLLIAFPSVLLIAPISEKVTSYLVKND